MGSPRIALLGLGEAGSLIAADLAAAGAEVVAYDPRPRPVPQGVRTAGSEAEAAAGAQAVLSLNWSWASREAARAALPGLTADAVYAEMNTSSPALKREVAEVVEPSGALFADVAVMSNVPGKGLRTPLLACGPGAERLAALLRPYGASVDLLAGEIGDAAGRKLLRSVFMKGFGAVVVEALEAARLAGLEDWMEGQIQAVLKTPGEARRFDNGTRLHAERRLHEMEASLELLAELGAPTTVTEATVANLRRLRREAGAQHAEPLSREPQGPVTRGRERTT